MEYGRVWYCTNCGVVETRRVILVRGNKVESIKKCLRCGDNVERKQRTVRIRKEVN